ncbi:MAG TPA: SNF2-related protein [Ktedonobacteraceae bacterium]|nr:SNF2-related protein [Ktedonobacteraceae bacterium]
MLNKQPLRSLLADDTGAGKTIMAGLLMKELMVRGDLRHCLIVAPGNLVERWQDELRRRFHRSFEILTNDRLETSVLVVTLTRAPLPVRGSMTAAGAMSCSPPRAAPPCA